MNAHRSPTILPPGFLSLDYQEASLDAAAEAIAKHGNTIIVAPPGAGKTIIGGAAIQTFLPTPVLFLQHNEELLKQNAKDARLLNPTKTLNIYTTENGLDANADIVFGIVNTAYKNIPALAARGFRSIVVDEAHRFAGEMFQAVFKAIQPEALLALSATPERADKTPLPEAGITNCCYEVPLQQLWENGRLVPPRPLSVALDGVVAPWQQKVMRRKADPVGDTLKSRVLAPEAIIGAVQRYAPGAKLIWACASVAQAQDMANAFTDAGLPARAVWGTSKTRGSDVAWHQAQPTGSGTHLFSVNLFIEGYNDPSLDGVGILRNFSHRSPFKQFLGRGARCAPGKTSFLALDFVGAFDAHPDVLQPSKFLTKRPKPGEAPTKECKGCGFAVHLSVSCCPSCGKDFPVHLKTLRVDKEVVLEEISLRKGSTWRWVDLGPQTTVASTYGAVGVARLGDDGVWRAYTQVIANNTQLKLLKWSGDKGVILEHEGTREECIAVLDERLNVLPNPGGYSSTKRAPWQLSRPSEKQIAWANQIKYPIPDKINGMRATAYSASCWINARLLLKTLKKSAQEQVKDPT